MADDGKHGLGGALAGVVADDLARAPVEDEADQLDMLAAEPLLGPVMRAEGGRIQRSGPGRPPGARNKRTTEWVDFILKRHRSPLIGLAEIMSTPLPDLARTLDCSTLEAAEFWRKCAAELAPYLHQKQATAIDVQGATAGMLVVNIGMAPAAGDAAPSPFGLDLAVAAQGEQYQGLSGDADPQSDGEQSDGEAK